MAAGRGDEKGTKGSDRRHEAPTGVVEEQRPTEEAKELAQQHEERALDG